jgi:hypothetical protein
MRKLEQDESWVIYQSVTKGRGIAHQPDDKHTNGENEQPLHGASRSGQWNGRPLR